MTEEGSELTPHQISRIEQARRKAEQLKDVNLGKRRFCQNILLLGVAAGVAGTGVACISQFLEDESTQPIQTPIAEKIPSSEEAYATVNAREPGVHATAEARSEDELREEIESLPQGIVRASYRSTEYVRSAPIESLGEVATVTLVGFVEEKNIYYGVGVKHHFNDSLLAGVDLDLLSLIQPQFGDTESIIAPLPIVIGHPDDDIAVFAFSGKSLERSLGCIGGDNVLINFEPSEGDSGYSMGFSGDEIWPTSYDIIQGGVYDLFFEKTGLVQTNEYAHGGQSGAGVVNREGKLLGVTIGGNYVGSVFQPLDDEFYRMVEQAVSEVDQKYNTK